MIEREIIAKDDDSRVYVLWDSVEFRVIRTLEQLMALPACG